MSVESIHKIIRNLVIGLGALVAGVGLVILGILVFTSLGWTWAEIEASRMKQFELGVGVFIGGAATLTCLGITLTKLVPTIPALRMTMEGQNELAGSVEATWATTGGADLGGGQYYIRVNGWPFQVTSAIYHWLSEGDEVAVIYSVASEKVARVDKLGASE